MNTEAPPHTQPSLPPIEQPPSQKSLWIETLTLWVLSCGMLVVVTVLSGLHPFLYENSQVLAAAFFLYVPIWWLERTGNDLTTFGLHSRQRRRSLISAALTCATIFPLFALGYHLFQVDYRERTPRFDHGVLHRWPQEIEGRPDTFDGTPPFVLWEEQDQITLIWTAPPSGETVMTRITADAPFVRVLAAEINQGELFVRSLGSNRLAPRWIAPNVVDIKTPKRGGVRLGVEQNSTLKVELWRNERPVPPDEVGLGARSAKPSTTEPLSIDRNYWWLLTLVLTHLLLVALPEEVFFRGYLQTRLDQLLTRRIRFLGAPIGLGLVTTSALFALSHYVVELDPNRLVVFFPSLLFGWLRNLTSGVMAPIVVHGMSNVLLLLLSRGYN